MKAHGLDQWLTLHLVGALVYHLPKWESGRHNLCERGYAFARPLPIVVFLLPARSCGASLFH
ncbi:hypothetical protein PVAP13_1NG538219 [Panicum virgatum]|uniref:Uncharacterized protein n=1 Tax=Panicum virgatum TaxID=38727 RepID=A0A8T0X9L0_PANVG|nr:hypothetical protein PVAP13_1NG538219 [Panicum virgatum]